MCLKLSMCLNDFLDQSLTVLNDIFVETVVTVRCYLPSAEGCCSCSKSHHLVGANIVLGDDIGI